MRWYSTPESAKQCEPTVLAIGETLLAVGLSIYLAVHFDTIRHIVFATLLAPVLLLRTESSTRTGLRRFNRWAAFLTKVSLRLNERSAVAFKSAWGYSATQWTRKIIALLTIVPLLLLKTPILPLVYIFLPLLAKVSATMEWIIRKPKHTLFSIPSNWVRISLSTDTMHPPELVPGIETDNHLSHCQTYRFRGVGSELFRQLMLNKQWWYHVLLVISVVAIFLPSIIYRFSLKSTSLIYFPLAWVVGWNQDRGSVEILIDQITTSPSERLSRWIAGLVLLLTIGALAFSYVNQKHHAELYSNPVFQYFVPVEQVNSWHITRIIAAIITLALLCYAVSIQIRLRNRRRIARDRAVSIVGWAKVFRMGLSLWTMICGIFILIPTIDWSSMPRVRWLPSRASMHLPFDAQSTNAVLQTTGTNSALIIPPNDPIWK